jgi:branched-chain amino acid transport system permease protein
MPALSQSNRSLDLKSAAPAAWSRATWPLRAVMSAAVVLGLMLFQSVLQGQFDPYSQQIIALAGINIILAVSLNLINGITGQFSLGHAGFMAVGAYSCAAFVVYAGPRLVFTEPIVFGLGLLVGAVVSGFAGLLVGLPSLRLRGDYLAIVTLGFGQIIISIIRNIEAVGGASGFSNLPKLSSLAWVYAMVIGCILCVKNLADSNLGRSMRAVRDDEVAAEAAGIDTTRVKVLAFVVSAMWAGVAGGLQAHYLQLAHPNDFSFIRSIEIVVMVVLGGLGSISGCTITAVALRVLEEKLRDANGALLVGVLLIVLAAALSQPGYRAQMKQSMLGWLLWLRWPALSMAALAAAWIFERDWIEANVSSLRYIIYALILIVLMLLRPQGLLGRSEITWRGLKKLARRG